VTESVKAEVQCCGGHRGAWTFDGRGFLVSGWKRRQHVAVGVARFLPKISVSIGGENVAKKKAAKKTAGAKKAAGKKAVKKAAGKKAVKKAAKKAAKKKSATKKG
jgi:hypothetical protein